MAKPEYLLLVVAYDEDELGRGTLPPGRELGALPDAVAEALAAVSPGLELEQVFLLKADTKITMAATLEAHALDYHHHVTRVRKEECPIEGCAEHPAYDNVVPLTRR